MVQKGEKATEVRLPDGPVSTAELSEVFGVAWADSHDWSTFVNLRWKDGRTATVRDQAELEYIEDTPGVTVVSGRFSYTDGSSLNFMIGNHLGVSTSATGVTARQRQTRIAQQWATFPRRSGLPRWVATFLWGWHWWLIAAAVLSTAYSQIFYFGQAPLWFWVFEIGVLLLGVSLWSYDRVSPHGQHCRHPIVYHRNDSSWQRVVGTASPVISFGLLLMAIVAWLYPRK